MVFCIRLDRRRFGFGKESMTVLNSIPENEIKIPSFYWTGDTISINQYYIFIPPIITDQIHCGIISIMNKDEIGMNGNSSLRSKRDRSLNV